MAIWALVAVNARAECKTRLAPVLPRAVRRELVRGMLDHVLRTAQACPAIERVALVSPERAEAARDLPLIANRNFGLSVAIQAAVALAYKGGATRALVLPGDLPRLQVADLMAMVKESPHGVAIAPDSAETGTDAISLPLPARFTFRFGRDSFAIHAAAAKASGCEAAVVRREGLCDLDLPDDLALLRACPWAIALGLDRLGDELSSRLLYSNRRRLSS